MNTPKAPNLKTAKQQAPTPFTTMPGLTITTSGIPVAGATGVHGTGSRPHPHPHPNPQSPAGRGSRSSSPSRPPVSPITPTLAPAQLPGASALNSSPLPSGNTPNFGQGRPTFTHSQPDQVGITQLPAAEPISFDDNPDVLALKSAISILQLQRARATADMQALNRAKAAALADPGAFVTDLADGRVNVEGDPLLSGRARAVDPDAMEDDDEDSSSSSEDDDEDDDEGEDSSMSEDPITDGTHTTNQPSRKRKKTKPKGSASGGDTTGGSTAWRKLPKPQTVVRCPPINWAQYGVVGESIDKLHAEQLAAPTLGAPATLGPGGTFEFKATPDQIPGDDQQRQQPPQRLPGIAAPYIPGKDRIEKKPRVGKR